MLKKSAEIREVLTGGRKLTGRNVTLFVLPSDETRFAVIVPKRIGNAVKRNRMKRLAREVYRNHQERFISCKLIIFVKRFHDNYASLETEINQLATPS